MSTAVITPIHSLSRPTARRPEAPRPSNPGAQAVVGDASATIARPTGRIRLTRRGRVVLTSLAAAPLIALAAWLGLNAGAATASSTPSAASFEYVTVEHGDSLWSLAGTLAPDADPRDVIADVMALNQLETSTVVPGQNIAIPERYTTP
ncbi:LysM peptidoglycan-binding domain-containing protein [Mycetocola zhujimingii]|uniref:LysM peptidoglycan-binding domain-containing protein n=1 Tax=Mycetocola zhujimingii TaxID=2079792 RepID=UPI001304C97C|nr:LysM peptidoglycan-binding domain-containing protein [Mycetocola zhujimingii]